MKLSKELLLEYHQLTEAKRKNSFGSKVLTGGLALASVGLGANLVNRISSDFGGKETVPVTGVENVAPVTAAETPKVEQEKSTAVAKKEETKPAVKTAPAITYHHDTIRDMVKEDEGFKTKMYSDTSKIPTIGIGHNLENTKQSKSHFIKAFGDQGLKIRNHVLSGGSMTHEQVNKLFDVDYEHHLGLAARKVPSLHTHPPEVQAALVSGTFRGHVTDSPTFLKHFNSGNYKAAADEFLDRQEYKNPERKKDGSPVAPGVITRLERDHKIYQNYAEQQPK